MTTSDPLFRREWFRFVCPEPRRAPWSAAVGVDEAGRTITVLGRREATGGLTILESGPGIDLDEALEKWGLRPEDRV